MPKTTFVALTRARRQLVVVQPHDYAAMPFVSWPAVQKTADIVDVSGSFVRQQHPPGRPVQYGLQLPKLVGPSDFARHVNEEELEALARTHLRITRTDPLPASAHIAAPDKVCTDAVRNHFETVSDLNGMAVTAALEARLHGTVKAFGIFGGRPPADPAAAAVWLTRAATHYEAHASRYRSRLHQMSAHAFDWLVPHLGPATDRLTRALEDEHAGRGSLTFEVPMERNSDVVERDGGSGKQSTLLQGRADIVHTPAFSRFTGARTTVWEVKFVGALSLEHAIQAAAYGFLWADARRAFPRLVLFNVRDGTRWDVETTREGACALVEGVLRAKFTVKGQTSTVDFLQTCARIRAEVEGTLERVGSDIAAAQVIPVKRRRWAKAIIEA